MNDNQASLAPVALVAFALVIAVVLAAVLFLRIDDGVQQVEARAFVRPVVEAETTTTTVPPTTTTTTPKYTKSQRVELFAANTGRCGGDLPPCWVMMRESGGDINAYNADGCYHADDGSSGCYGKWQCDPRTCDGTGTEEEQDAEARRVWDGGRGCSHWNAC